ncbi:MAG: tail protein X [Burkholderiales bacterium]
MTAHAATALRRTSACFLLCLAAPAGAIGLGEMKVDSFLGEPLEATVALVPAPGTTPRADCFAIGRAAPGALPQVGRASFAVEPAGDGWRLRIRSRSRVHEPAVRLRLDASCEGRDAASRTYEVLLDPRPASAPAPALRTLPGDTLAAIAAAIYPSSPAVRDAYLKALREANPGVAGLSPNQPVPPGTAIVLPDLRRFSLDLALSEPSPARAAAASASAPAGKAAREEKPAVAKRATTKPVVAKPEPAAAESPATSTVPTETRPAKPPAATAATRAPKAAPSRSQPAEAPTPTRPAAAPGGRFVLRLSSPEVDLSRSRGIDDRMRSQLRERLLVLDADDQVAALLSMRNSLRQLEGRVAELQLKLSTLPPTLRSPAAATPPPPSPPATAPAPAAAPPPPPAPAPTAAPAPPPAPAPVPRPESPPVSPPVAPPAPAVAPAAGPAKPAAPASAQPDAPKDRKPASPGPSADLPEWLWGVLALLVVAIAVLAWRMLSRRRVPAAPVLAPAPASLATPPAAGDGKEAGAPDAALDARPHRLVADSDASLATEVPAGDPASLRHRYIVERFPEIATGSIAPDEPDSVVKAARLFYEDGATPRAIELLHFVVEEDPGAIKPWLALFEIFRLERLAGPFADLAARFREHHGGTQAWRKVQFIGREIDPRNPLYQEAAFDSLETVGFPVPARQEPVTFDPLAENWLNAPMDFTTVALAASLRHGILADAGLRDVDLVANPMPALKSVEIFTVA